MKLDLLYDEIFTVAEVIDEVRDETARNHLRRLKV